MEDEGWTLVSYEVSEVSSILVAVILGSGCSVDVSCTAESVSSCLCSPSTSARLITETSEKKKESTESQLMDGLSGTCGDSWGRWDTLVTVVVEWDFGQSAVRKYVVCLVGFAALFLVLSGLILSIFALVGGRA